LWGGERPLYFGPPTAILAVDDTSVYFTSTGAPTPADPTASRTVPALYRLPKKGGLWQPLDEGVVPPIVVDGHSLVYRRATIAPFAVASQALAYSGAQAQAQPDGGSELSSSNLVALGDQCTLEAIPNAGGANSVAFGPVVDGALGVSWLGAASSTGPATVLHWIPSTGVTTPIGSTATALYTSFAGDADHVYWSEGSDPTTITALPSSGGSPTAVATLSGAAVIAGVDDDAIYVGPPTTGQSGPIVRIGKTDGATGTLVPNVASVTLYAVHDTNVYWSAGDGILHRVPKTGGPSQAWYDSLANIDGVGFDACNAYVTSNGSRWPSGGVLVPGFEALMGVPLSYTAFHLSCDASYDDAATTQEQTVACDSTD
jgi:hypothetical protein